MKKVTFFLMTIVLLGTAALAGAAGPKFYGVWTNADGGGRVNRHNLSGDPRHTASVTYKATYDPADRRTTEICIFCHTPHNATPSTPLWGHKQTMVSSFNHYTSPNLKLHTDATAKSDSAYGEPNYSSRLCLSCHDGATALGAVLNGPEIPFDGGNVITPSGHNVFNPSFGEQDATQHHHPISFKYTATVKDRLNTLENGGGNYYKLPIEDNFPPGGGSGYQRPNEVKLDRYGYMQCATCHNPHQNMSDDDTVTPFWVTGVAQNPPNNVHDTVCKVCHTFVDESYP